MLFRNTHLLSPIANKIDLPFETDLYYHDYNEIPDNEAKLEKYLKSNGIEVDTEWWYEQRRRCLEGYTIEDAMEKGGDAIVDGRDAIWNETAKPIEFWNENFDFKVIIPPESVYLQDADLICPKGNITITNRHYFYLNFFKMYNEDKETGKKDILNPSFIDMDFLKFYRIHLQEKFGKDNTEAKSRQLGFSKASAGGILGFNYLFVRASTNVIVAGNDEDADELFITTVDGIEMLKNTQFYKAFSVNSKSNKKLISKYYKTRILGFTTGQTNEQVLSRLVPYWVIYEEVGKWAKGLVEAVRTYVEPSIITTQKRFGYQTFIGTGGDMDLGADDMEKMHYSQDSNTFLRFKNKFERLPVEDGNKSGWFSSKAWFSSVDKDGNSNLKLGAEFVKEIIKAEKDSVKKYKKITQWALFASDAFQISTAGYFGEYKINLLNARLSEIKLHKELQVERYGVLEWKDKNNSFKGVNFIETNEEEAFVVIVEEPMKDEEENDIINLYETGIDSYDMDESMTSVSKGSAVVRKKFIDSNSTYDFDVAMILERPKSEKGGASKFFEHCAMLSIYYNKAMMTIEHTKVRIIDWLELNGFGGLIALRPVIAFANVVNKSQANNRFGIDGSMKPHVMAMMSDKLTPEFISRMFITKQIIALAKYKYSRNYNCDITVATAHANVAAKESVLIVPKSESKKKKRVVKHSVFKKQNGVLQRVFV